MRLGLQQDLGSCMGKEFHHNAAQVSIRKATEEPEKTALLERQTGTSSQSIVRHALEEVLVEGCVGDEMCLQQGLMTNR